VVLMCKVVFALSVVVVDVSYVILWRVQFCSGGMVFGCQDFIGAEPQAFHPERKRGSALK